MGANSMLSLRDYQQRAIDSVNEAIQNGSKSILVVAPTGAGKSVLIGTLASQYHQQGGVLILAHRKELIDQNLEKIHRAGVSPTLTGVIKSGDKRRNPTAPIQVASIDSIRRWVGKKPMPPATLVIVDECHRVMAPSYQLIAEQYPSAIQIGFTATPWRLDGKTLRDFYKDMIIAATIPELIEKQWLAPPRCYTHPEQPDLSQIEVDHGEFNEKQLEQLMCNKVLLGSIPEHYKKLAIGRATFGFAVSIQHAQQLAQVCNEAGIPSTYITGKDTPERRAQALSDLRTGAIKILWNVALFTEGTDVEEVKCIILARPTLSHALAFQMIGRGMRPSPWTGFHDLVVLDHAGILRIHGLPTDPQDYCQEAKQKKNGPSKIKRCPSCNGALNTNAKICPYCGYSFAKEEETTTDNRRLEPLSVDGELVECAAVTSREVSYDKELKMCSNAYLIALRCNAKDPIRYANSIVKRQLLREPREDIFQQAIVQVVSSELTRELELKICINALETAWKYGAKDYIRYSMAIIERQILRRPEKSVFEQAYKEFARKLAQQQNAQTTDPTQ